MNMAIFGRAETNLIFHIFVFHLPDHFYVFFETVPHLLLVDSCAVFCIAGRVFPANYGACEQHERYECDCGVSVGPEWYC